MATLALILVPLVFAVGDRAIDRLDALGVQINDTSKIQAVLIERIKNAEKDIKRLEGGFSWETYK